MTVVKNLQSRPYIAEQLCDLLGMRVDDFLRLTEVHILPYLVLTKKRDIITRIAATYKPAKSPFDLCSEKNNLAAILAFLLSQAPKDPEGMIMPLLAEVDSTFKGHSLAELVRSEPILIACELLRWLGDSRGTAKAERVSERSLRVVRAELRLTLFLKIRQALRDLAVLVPRKTITQSTASSTASKRSTSLYHFIEGHVLGIITQFTNTVNDFHVRQPLVEKKRNVAAIGEMIKIARSHASSALPQV